MSTQDEQPEPRITGLADLARFIAPDNPMSVVEALMEMRHGLVTSRSVTAIVNPRVWQTFKAWDALEEYPTASQLRRAVTRRTDTNDVLSAHQENGVTPLVLPFNLVETDYRIAWYPVGGDEGGSIGVARCALPTEGCAGMLVYTRHDAMPEVWTVRHLTAQDAAAMGRRLARLPVDNELS